MKQKYASNDLRTVSPLLSPYPAQTAEYRCYDKLYIRFIIARKYLCEDWAGKHFNFHYVLTIYPCITCHNFF